MTSGLVQPALLPRNRPQTRREAPRAGDEREAGNIERGAGPKLSRKRDQHQRDAIRPIGRLIQKIHCQPKSSVMAPPIAGPAMQRDSR